jgi:hypothetical protein
VLWKRRPGTGFPVNMAAMELTDLNAEERLALVALVRTAALADHAVSEQEEEALADLVDAFGEDAYREAFEAADNRFGNQVELESFLRSISRQEARELIYGTVLDLTMADAITGAELPLLRWLAGAWNVESTFEPPDGEPSA